MASMVSSLFSSSIYLERTIGTDALVESGLHMIRNKESWKGLFSYLDIPKMGDKEQIANTITMTVEFMKYQGEVAYEIGKRQAIALTSTASTIGIGWSAFFFGIAQGSWFTSSVGVMMVLAATFLLTYWTPRFVDRTRRSLDEIGAAKFYKKWLAKNEGLDSARIQ